MVNGGCDFRFDASDFRFQRRDAGGEFVDGQRIEILALEQRQRIFRPARKEIVEIHGRKLTPGRGQVNKRGGRMRSRPESVAR